MRADTDLGDLARKYRVVNIKLDKTGGLTEALALKQAARAAGLRIMVGCMVSTSLAMAPAMMLSGDADFVDLDGPLLLREDRPNGVSLVDERLQPPPSGFWGSPPLSQKKTSPEKSSDQLE